VCAQAALVFDVHENIPKAVMNIFTDPKFKGGAILGLPQSGVLRTPTASEISLNYTWLLPLVKAFPTKEGTIVLFELHQKPLIYVPLYQHVNKLSFFGVALPKLLMTQFQLHAKVCR